VLRYLCVNFEAPLERDLDGYRTLDYGLDLIVHVDGRREWKDVPDLAVQLRAGRIDQESILAVLAETERVVAELDSGAPCWSGWDGWLPSTDLRSGHANS
jgi:predicted RNA-binding protein associated with RNAse of E/G family